MTPLLRNPPKAPRRGPEFYWAQAKRFGARGFTVAELHARTRDVSSTTVKLYVHKLRDVGAIVKIGDEPTTAGGFKAARWAVARPHMGAPVRSGAVSQDVRGRRQWQLWTAMRAMPQFFVRELAAQASTDEIEVSYDTASNYVSALLSADLVLVVTPPHWPKSKGAGRIAGVYRLRPSANTGPAALKLIGNRVFDPNTRAFVGLALDGSEVAA